MTRDEAFTEWPAPAKVNLFLQVIGRRDDGYHWLETVFQLLDWGDTVRLRARADGVIARVSDDPRIPADSDLVVRAARLLRDHSGTPLGADIAVDKRIPLGGGLGGGSSDAATTLVGLNLIWGLGLSREALATLGLRLGADVPVFVAGHSAFAEGVGERLTPINLPERWFVVVDPGVAVSTAAIFQDPDLTRNSSPTTISRFLAGQWPGNDLQPVVCARHLEVARALAWLARCGNARMSGSGACVFAVFDDVDAANAIALSCPSPWRAFVARGVDKSPLEFRARQWHDRASGAAT